MTPPATPAEGPRGDAAAARLVILAGVCAALQVGKLPPAIAALQADLGLTLVQAGFLLSLVQLAGMSAGLAFGALADGLGLKRSIVLGLVVLGAVGTAGGLARGAPALLALRALEGFGFLLVVLPAPGLLRRLVAPERVNVTLGIWGAYMPFGTALALLGGPAWIGALGWRSWWWLIAATSIAAAAVVARRVPAFPPAPRGSGAPWPARLRQTLAAPGPWLVAAMFAAYSSQWLAVIGFLPVIYTHAGIPGAATGALTALAAAVNIAGNLGAGRLLHRGVAPPRLLGAGFVVMALAALAAFAGSDGAGLPAGLRYAAVLAFSAVGGAIPTTLFALALRAAPSEQTVSSTVGWVQQWSALGQFVGPPVVAWVASRAHGWHWTWVVTGALSLLGLALSRRAAALR